MVGPNTTVMLEAEASSASTNIVKVDFYANEVLLGAVTNQPYTLVWTTGSSGDYAIRVVATDASGASAFAEHIIGIGALPSITILTPYNGQTVWERADIHITTTNHLIGIQRVEFYANSVKIGESFTEPYSFDWSNAVSGDYILQAVAIDSYGKKRVSLPSRFSASYLTVGVLSPYQYTAAPGQTIQLGHNWRGGPVTNYPYKTFIHVVDDSDIDQFGGGGPLPNPASGWSNFTYYGENLEVPTNAGPGAYKILTGLWSNSIPRLNMVPGNGVVEHEYERYETGTMIVTTNALNSPLPPAVSLTAPTNVLGNIALSANASDADGTISKVEFYADGAKIGEDPTSPYGMNWTNACTGKHTLLAVAYDDENHTTTSDPVEIVANYVTVDLATPNHTVAAPGDAIVVTHYWQGSPTASPHTALTELLDEAGNVAFQEEFSPELSTTHWTNRVAITKKLVLPSDITSGMFRISTRLHDGTNWLAVQPGPGVGTMTVTNSVVRYQIGTVLVTKAALVNRFNRGTGTNPVYQSFVISLDAPHGVAFDDIGGNADYSYPGNPWTTNKFHYNADIPSSETNVTERLRFRNPIVSFGRRMGGSPLRVNHGYTFGVYAGSPEPYLTNALSINVYYRTNFGYVGTISITIPTPDDISVWWPFLTAGGSVTTNHYGLTTTLSFNGSLDTWGTDTNQTFRLTHRADSASLDYVYEVTLAGQTDKGWMVTDASGQRDYSPLYTLEFEADQAWQSVLLERPYFDGKPLPPSYDGKTVEELMDQPGAISNTISALFAPTNYLSLDHSPELRRHKIVDDFVTDMRNDPIALANYVCNEIRLTDAIDYNSVGAVSEKSVNVGGINRGALATYLEGQGSPVEQCALLIYLLRQAGVPATYVYPEHNRLSVLDSRLSRILRMQLKGARDSAQEISVPKLIPVNYPWVAAYDGTNWVHLFPWLKDTEIVEGFNLYNYMPTNYNNGLSWARDYFLGNQALLSLDKIDTPAVLFPKTLEQSLLQSYAGISIGDIGTRAFDRRQNRLHWSDFPRPTQVSGTPAAVESLAVITNAFPSMTNLFDTLRIEVFVGTESTPRIDTGDFRTLDLHNRQFLLWFDETNGNHNMILSLEPFRGEATNKLAFSSVNPNELAGTNLLNQVVTTNQLTSGEDIVRLKFTHRRNRAAENAVTNPPPHWDAFMGFSHVNRTPEPSLITEERTIRKGDLQAICINVGTVSDKMLQQTAEKYWPVERQLQDDANYANQLTPEFYAGRLMYLMGMSYFNRLDRFKHVNQALHKVQTVSWYAVGLAGLQARRDAGTGALLPGEIQPDKPTLDIFHQQLGYAGNGTLRPDLGEDYSNVLNGFFPIFVADAAAQEHRTLDRYFVRNDSVSAVRLLHSLGGDSITINTIFAATDGNSAVMCLYPQNYLNMGESTFSGTKLKDFDPKLWQVVTNAFTSCSNTNYVQALMTFGPATNTTGTYKGFAAIIFTPDYASALISSNLLNGSLGLPPSGMFFGSPFINLGTDIHYDSSSIVYSDVFGRSPVAAFNYYIAPSDALGFIFGENNYIVPSLGGQVPPSYTQNYVDQFQAGYSVPDPITRQYLVDYMTQILVDPEQPLSLSLSFLTRQDKGDIGKVSFWAHPLKWVFDPVSAISGEFYVDTVDLELPGPFPLQIRRNYSSQNRADNGFGSGWKMNYFSYLQINGNNDVIYAAEMDGSVLAYSYDTNRAAWYPDPALNPELNNMRGTNAVPTPNVCNNHLVATTNTVTGVVTNYTLTDVYGGVRQYEVRAYPLGGVDRERPYLYSWRDAQGNSLGFTYGSDANAFGYGQVTRIQSSNGAFVQMLYDQYGNVVECLSGDGRRLLYGYDQYGDLTSVTLPDRSTVEYEYQHVSSIYTTNQVNQAQGPVTIPQSPGGWLPWSVWPQPCQQAFPSTGWYVYFNENITNMLNIIDGAGTNVVLVGKNWQVTASLQYGWQNSGGNFTTNIYYTTNWITQSTVANNGTNVVSTHLLTCKIEPNGRVLKNVYDDQRRVTNQLATVGQDLQLIQNATFVYSNNFVFTNAFTNLVHGTTLVLDVFGNTNRFEYTNGLLINIVDPKGYAIQQEWYWTNAAGGYTRAIKSQTDKRGLNTTSLYDTNGNLVTNIVSGADLTGSGQTNAILTYAYNTNYVLTAQTDALGKTIRYRYSNTNYPFLRTAVELYDGAGSPIVTNVFTYANAITVFTNGQTAYTNRACGVLVQERAAAGTVDEHVTDFARDGRGFITQIVRYTGTPDPAVTNYYAYNDRGEMAEQMDVAGRTVHQTYDPLGRPTATEKFDANGNLVYWDYSYYNENGELTWSDGPRYNPEDYVWRDYDGAGRNIVQVRWRSRARADGGGVEAEGGEALFSTTINEFDAYGNQTRVIDPLGNYVTNSYDSLGQLVVSVHCDSAGVPLATNLFAYEPGGLLSAQTNALGGVTRKYYTTTGKLCRQENPDGSTNGWVYLLDGRVATNSVANGSYWKSSYDDANRTVTRTLRTANGAFLSQEIDEFDRHGNLVRKTDAQTNIFLTTFDGLNRVKTVTGPAGTGNAAQQITTNYYDAAGTVVTNANVLGEKTVTTFDAIGRTIQADILSASGALVRRTTTSYAPDFHSQTVTVGTGANAISTTTFTDTFSKPVLTVFGDDSFTLNRYDMLGNLVSSQDELGQATQFSYDPFYRLRHKILPDQAVITFGYDVAGNLTSRVMPGGQTWSATYDSASRKTSEKLTNGVSTTRNFIYAYYPANSTTPGLLQTISDPRGVTTTLIYDAFLRVKTNSAAGPLSDQNQVTIYSYDNLGRITGLTQTTSGRPSTQVNRSYSPYGQVIEETVLIDGSPVRDEIQVWNAAGRRAQLYAPNLGTGSSITFSSRADGLLGQVTQAGQVFTFDFADNGLLKSRSNPWRTLTVNERDSRGRLIQATTTVGGTTPLVDILSWRDNSTLDGYTANRQGSGTWNESRAYSYNTRGQLTNETFAPQPSANAAYAYTFDSNKLGVRTGATVSGALSADWQAGTLDNLAHVTNENWNVSQWHTQAKGYAIGANSVSAWLDDAPLSVLYDSTSTNGLWQTEMAFGSGSHTLRATAYHPLGRTNASATNVFIAVGVTNINSGYDAVGNLITRTFSDGRVQTLSWDALGRLMQVSQRDAQTNGFDWTAVYDALGRRLQTVNTPISNNVAQTSTTIDSWYDPQVEFLEIGVAVNGARTWKVNGPDLNGGYGASQGVGGLEATVRESDGYVTPILNDSFGNVVATVYSGQVVWAYPKLTGYGPVAGYSTPVLSPTLPLADATLWRTRRMDPTGFFWLGARYYDANSGRFLSTDPLGHEGSMSLYAFAGGDPVNYFDPDGRLMKSTLQAVGESEMRMAETHGYVGKAMYEGIAQVGWDAGIIHERARTAGESPYYESGSFMAASFIGIRQAYDGWTHTDTATGEIYSPGQSRLLLVTGSLGALATVWGPGISLGARLEVRMTLELPLAAKGGPLVRGADEAFSSALFQEATKTVENVGGFRLYGNKGLVGDTFTRNVFLVEAETKGAASLRGFVNALEGEARAAGANQLSIVGHQVINPGFLNPAVAQRFGFTFRQVNETTIQLVKPLP